MTILVEEPASQHAFVGTEEVVSVSERKDNTTVSRPSLTLSPAAFASLPASVLGGNVRPPFSPALIPLLSPLVQEGGSPSPKLSSTLASAESSPGAGTITPITKALGQLHVGSIRSPVPWKLGIAPPAAPHLSEDKESFSPLPRTPDGNGSSANSPFCGGSVFAKMQEKYLAECASTKGQDSLSTPTSASPLLSAPHSSRAILGSPAGLGLGRRASLGMGMGSSELSPYSRRHEGWNRRPSLLGAGPVGYASLGGWTEEKEGHNNGNAIACDEEAEAIGGSGTPTSPGVTTITTLRDPSGIGLAAIVPHRTHVVSFGTKNGLHLEGLDDGDEMEATYGKHAKVAEADEEVEDDETTTMASGIKFTVTVDGK